MKIGTWTLLLAATALVAGCGDFWQNPNGSSTSFTLSNSGNISIAPGSTGSATITVTPSNSFTGTVTLSCSVTTPSGASSPTTCSLSPDSVSITSTAAETSTLTATTTGSTTTGAYEITVTGASGSVSETTTVCAEVTTSSGSCSSTASASGDFYILNSDSITGYTVSSSVLTALSGSPYGLPTGVTPFDMTVNPAGTLLFVSTDAGIFVYTIGTGGALTLNATPIYEDQVAKSIQVDSTGTWLLDASDLGALYAIPITSTGTVDESRLTSTQPPSQALAGQSVQQMAISPDNNLVAVALGSAGTEVFSFASGAGTGTNPLSTPKTVGLKGVSAVATAFGPETSALYIGETSVFSSSTNSGGLRIIPISSDVLGTEPSASPYASGGTGPHAILPVSTGYVYVANWEGTATGNITGFEVTSGSSPTLTVLSSTFATGTEPSGLAEDNTDSFVLAVSTEGDPDFSSYTFDQTTLGNLDVGVTSSNTGSSPIAVVAVP